jgi:hypothetical protein
MYGTKVLKPVTQTVGETVTFPEIQALRGCKMSIRDRKLKLVRGRL